MTFLNVNGFAIPVADATPKVVPTDIGSRQRAFSGSLLTDRRARKRVWTMTTPFVTELVAKAIEGAVAGLGQAWGFDFDDGPNLTPNLFSSKGLGALAAKPVGSVRFGLGGTGGSASPAIRPLVVDEAGVATTESQFGSGSGTVELGATNILGADQRDAEGTFAGSYVAVGAPTTAAVTATVALQGSQSVLLTTTSTPNQGVETVPVSASVSTVYVGCVYVRSVLADTGVSVVLIDDVGTIATKSVTTSTGNWMRIQVTGTSDGAATTIKLRVISTASSVQTFNIDAWQIETGSIATTWVDGTRAIGDLEYPTSVFTVATDLTINAWVRGLTPVTGERVLVNARGASELTTRLKVWRATPAGNLIAFRTNGPVANDTITAAVFTGSPVWRMITAVMRVDPESGENKKTLMVDGVVISTSNPSDLPDLSQFTTRFEVGHEGAIWHWGSDQLFDDLQVLPFAATAAQALGWFNSGRTVANLPRVFLDGDIMPDAPGRVLAEGTVTSNFSFGVVAGGASRNNLRRVSFELQEV